jgi:glycosyltransferase involved in cell wall biosynthesis
VVTSNGFAAHAVVEPVDRSASYAVASRLAAEAQHDEARRLYQELAGAGLDSHERALIQNDLAVMAAMEGRLDEALGGWQAAIEIDCDCLVARLNRDLVQAEMGRNGESGDTSELILAPAPMGLTSVVPPHPPFGHPLPARGEGEESRRSPGGAVRVAILSFLFNWPSTGGGNHHTAELTHFLARAGYEVKHIFAQYPGWGIGRVTEELISPSEAIVFDEATWNVAEIQARYRAVVDAFAPDHVIITDSWNMKPLLAEAVRGYPYMLLYQAQENLCPLNNLRLLAMGPNRVEQCPRNQLATPDVCCRCLAERGSQSGSLHRVERELAGVGTRAHYDKLRQSLSEAEAVLVLNPVIEAMLQPYASQVRVVPWGMDSARFPWPVHEGAGTVGRPAVVEAGGIVSHSPNVRPAANAHHATLFMASVAGETIKGYHVAHEACRILRETRSDFELVVTHDPPGPIDEFTRSVGWCSLADLPRHYRAADICLVPTIAQDSLSRTSVEAMASGIPVIASRIGGLPYTVTDGVSGLLCEPGDPADLALKIGRLLDDPDLRRLMGLAGRKRFEDEFVWEDVIERYFRPMLSHRRVGSRAV